MFKLKSILIFLILAKIAVSAENETAKNTCNSDINNSKYINPNDYCRNEKGESIQYTSYTGSFNNTAMTT